MQKQFAPRAALILASIVLFSLIVGFASLCVAEQPPQPPSGALSLTFCAKTLADSKTIANRTVVYFLRNVQTNKKTLLSGTTSAEGTFTAYVDAGNWFLHAEIDSIENRNRADYAAALTLNVERDSNETIHFQRVTSVSGIVASETNETIPNALVEVNCLQGWYELKELNAETTTVFEKANSFRTDASGAFLLKFAPIGECAFTATAATAANAGGALNESASQLVELKEGELARVNIQIRRKQNPQNNYPSIVLIAALALALLLVAWFGRDYWKKKKDAGNATETVRQTEQSKTLKTVKPRAAENEEKTREETSEKNKEEKMRATKKMRDVMNALNERERRIVETLIAQNGKLRQSKIYRETLIPKTSLARALESLERRNVVKLTPEGNTQLVELTDWFTSK